MRIQTAALAALTIVACGGSFTLDATADDARDDCVAVYAEEAAACRAGVDITSVSASGDPATVVASLSEAPAFSPDVLWYLEVTMGNITCGVSNMAEGGEGGEAAPYGYSVLSPDAVVTGTCGGGIEGTSVTVILDIELPDRPFVVTVNSGTASLSDLTDLGAGDEARVQAGS